MALFHDEYTCYSFSFYIKTVHIISFSQTVQIRHSMADLHVKRVPEAEDGGIWLAGREDSG